VTPSKNQAQFIERCIRSVTSQASEGLDLDYVVIDAVSEDGTRQILERLVKEFPQLTVIMEPDKGQADALAKGFANSDADVFGWLNSDDILLPGCLTQVAAAFSDTDVDVVYGKAWFIDGQDRVIGAYPTAAFDAAYLKTFCFLSQPSTFFRRRAYRRAGGMDASLQYCMDYSLWIRLAETGARFRFLPGYLSATRLHETSKTSTGGLEFADEVVAMLRRQLNSVPLEWTVYRRFRALQGTAPQRSALLSFLTALIENVRQTNQPGRLVGWALRVFVDHAKAQSACILRRVGNERRL
jgi:GT2 family glycosyltransferase